MSYGPFEVPKDEQIDDLIRRLVAAERSRDEAREALRECLVAIRRMDPSQEMVTDDSPLMARAARVLSGEKEGAPTSPPAPEEDKP